jgi:Flp pilus assembly protein TadG
VTAGHERRADRSRRDRGQAAVEFAITLPLVVLLVLGIVQVALVVRDQLALELAAREGARAAAVSATPSAAAEAAARAAVTLRPLDVATSERGGRVTVEVRHRSESGVPILGALVGPIELRAVVTMARDPP